MSKWTVIGYDPKLLQDVSGDIWCSTGYQMIYDWCNIHCHHRFKVKTDNTAKEHNLVCMIIKFKNASEAMYCKLVWGGYISPGDIWKDL